MVRDVYAADEQARDAHVAGNATAVFRAVLDLDPQGPSRVLGILAMANIAPVSVVGERRSRDEWVMEVVVGPITPQTADFLNRKVAQLSCVYEATMETAARPGVLP